MTPGITDKAEVESDAAKLISNDSSSNIEDTDSENNNNNNIKKKNDSLGIFYLCNNINN